jgi:CMP-N-acetylneuraminic acid synthetase
VKPVAAFLPCRANSERLPNKNRRPFAEYRNGLLELKLGQIIQCKNITQVIVSSDDEDILNVAQEVFKDDVGRLVLDRRPDHLAASDATTDDLIKYAAELMPGGTMLWTHVTSPFVDAAAYDDMIATYQKAIDAREADSLMSVTTIRKFVWDEQGPLNYSRSKVKWPRTNTIRPVFEINSAAFICDVQLMRELGDRIGSKPWLYELKPPASFDIDWEGQFDEAEKLFKQLKLERITADYH